jgi:flagellin
MGMVLNTNIGAIQAQRALTESRAEMEKAMERLATGLRINSAADDAAGLAMVERMNSQIRGLTMATKNANDGIALIKTTENALVEVSGMLQRMRELAVQAANATNSDTERAFANDEINQLQQEVSRVSANTRYNGTQILNGSFSAKSLQVGIMSGEDISFSIDSVESGLLGVYEAVSPAIPPVAVSSTAYASTNNGVDGDDLTIVGNGNSRTVTIETSETAKDVATKINAVAGATTVLAQARTTALFYSSSATDVSYTIKVNNVETAAFTLSSAGVTDAVTKINAITASTGVMASATSDGKVRLIDQDGDNITIENTTATVTSLYVGALENDGATAAAAGNVANLLASGGNDITTISGTIRLTSTKGFTVTQDTAVGAGSSFFTDGEIAATLGAVSSVDVSTTIGASNALAILDGALDTVSAMRGSLGTLQNRLDYAVSNLMKVTEYTIGSRSRIQDADFAAETSRLAKAQVLQQAGAAMLSQANASTDTVLQLLRG